MKFPYQANPKVVHGLVCRFKWIEIKNGLFHTQRFFTNVSVCVGKISPLSLLNKAVPVSNRKVTCPIYLILDTSYFGLKGSYKELRLEFS